MDCRVHGVAKSRTQLSDFHFQKCIYTHTHKSLTCENFLTSKEKDITNKSEQIPLLTGFTAQSRKKLTDQKKNNQIPLKKKVNQKLHLKNEKIKR